MRDAQVEKVPYYTRNSIHPQRENVLSNFQNIKKQPIVANRMIEKQKLSALVAFGLMLLSPAMSHAGSLVYTPINPNFGGSPFNDGILLGTANAQNGYEAPREEVDPTERFVQSLQSRLFSGLARQVEDAIFGDNPQDSGTFTVGDQQVRFERGLETISLEISNLADGSITIVEVPVIDIE
jgi:curli production assembly/transport component CsgF